jgi:hypothetical protein
MNENSTNELVKYKIKINKININNDSFIIESTEGIMFLAPIKKGSVQCKIFNESNQEVNLGNIEENNLVTIIGCKTKETIITDEQKLYNYLINEKSEKNIIVIRKIIIKNNYVFNSDSSNENDIFD